MTKFIIFIICLAFGILAILNYFIWQPVEETPAPKTESIVKETALDPKALLNNPPKDSIKGELTSLNGELKWQSRAASKSAEITQLQPLQQGELIETGDNGTAAITFDTTTVELSPKSSLEFPQTLPGKFMFVQRSGEVLYENSERAALSVRVRALIALLTTGSMNISILEDEPTITIENIKGTVEVAYNNSNLESHVFTLKPGDVFSFNTEEREGEVL